MIFQIYFRKKKKIEVLKAISAFCLLAKGRVLLITARTYSFRYIRRPSLPADYLGDFK